MRKTWCLLSANRRLISVILVAVSAGIAPHTSAPEWHLQTIGSGKTHLLLNVLPIMGTFSMLMLASGYDIHLAPQNGLFLAYRVLVLFSRFYTQEVRVNIRTQMSIKSAQLAFVYRFEHHLALRVCLKAA